MKITNYSWSHYISTRKLNKSKAKLYTLFKIRDAIIEADLNEEEMVTITFTKIKDFKEVLGFAGSVHYWWVIDFVIEDHETIYLLYRNCKIHKDTDPNQLWEEKLTQLKTEVI